MTFSPDEFEDRSLPFEDQGEHTSIKPLGGVFIDVLVYVPVFLDDLGWQHSLCHCLNCLKHKQITFEQEVRNYQEFRETSILTYDVSVLYGKSGVFGLLVVFVCHDVLYYMQLSLDAAFNP